MTALDRSSKFAGFASSLNKKLRNQPQLRVNINVGSVSTAVEVNRSVAIPGWVVEDLLKQSKALKGELCLTTLGEVRVDFKDA